MQAFRAVFFVCLGGFPLIAGSSISLAQREIEAARMEIQRVEGLVKAGALPMARLMLAEEKLADAEDDQVLERTLYGSVKVGDLTGEQASEMTHAAERRVDRARERVEQLRKLADDGVLARNPLSPLEDDLEAREMALTLARGRARLFEELSESARLEEDAESAEAKGARGPVMEHFEGSGRFDEPRQLKRIVLAFQKKFDQPLPVSADGETAVHRSLGFDHRGRVDVAVNPDAPQGQWLRHYLKLKDIPYYVFRAAIPGKATGAHIHIGPGSTRLHNAD